MLIELRDVEVHIEPEKVLVQALQEGDISTNTIIRECIEEDGSSDIILGAISYDDIDNFCKRTGISQIVPSLEEITQGLKELSDTDKAKLLWLLLKSDNEVLS